MTPPHFRTSHSRTLPAMPQPRTDDKPVVCITGNNGLIGAALTRAIQDRYCVVGLDRDGQPQPPPEVECIVFDVTDETSVDLALRRVRYAYGPRLASFVHLAAYYDFAGGDAAKYDAITVHGHPPRAAEPERPRVRVRAVRVQQHHARAGPDRAGPADR